MGHSLQEDQKELESGGGKELPERATVEQVEEANKRQLRTVAGDGAEGKGGDREERRGGQRRGEETGGGGKGGETERGEGGKGGEREEK